MQFVKLPKVVLGKIDRIASNFLWGSSDSKMKIHNVRWQQVCKPLLEWGLGIIKAKDKNISLLMTLAWRFNISSKDSLWATTIKDKYSTSSANYNSTIWNSLTLGWKHCQASLFHLVGNDLTTSFWMDTWCGKTPLDLIEVPQPEIEVNNS